MRWASTRALLAEVAETPSVIRPPLIGNRLVTAAAPLLGLLFGGVVPPARVRSERV